MPKCPHCGIERETLTSPCMICGYAPAPPAASALPAAISVRVCPSCGTGISETTAQCPLCLKHIDRSDRKKTDAFSAEAVKKAVGKTIFWLTLYASLILAYFALDTVSCFIGSTVRRNKDKYSDVTVTTGNMANGNATVYGIPQVITDPEEIKRVNALLDAPTAAEVTKPGGMASDTQERTVIKPFDLSTWVYSFFSRCLFGIALILLARGIRAHPYQTARLLGCAFWLLILRVFVILPLNRDILGHNLIDELLLHSNIQPSGAAGMWPLFLITANVWKSWRNAKRFQTNAEAQGSKDETNHAKALLLRTALTAVTDKPQPDGKAKMMNATCQKILVAYIATLAIMLLFPPMVIQTGRSQWLAYKFQFIGSIGSHPNNWGVLEMNLKQLAIQVIIVSLMAMAGCLVFKAKKD